MSIKRIQFSPLSFEHRYTNLTKGLCFFPHSYAWEIGFLWLGWDESNSTTGTFRDRSTSFLCRLWFVSVYEQYSHLGKCRLITQCRLPHRPAHHWCVHGGLFSCLIKEGGYALCLMIELIVDLLSWFLLSSIKGVPLDPFFCGCIVSRNSLLVDPVKALKSPVLVRKKQNYLLIKNKGFWICWTLWEGEKKKNTENILS